MTVSYAQLRKSPTHFKNLTGLTVLECERVVEKTRPEYQNWERTKKCLGRHSKFLTLEDIVI